MTDELVVGSMHLNVDGFPGISITTDILSATQRSRMERVLSAIASRQQAFLQFGPEWLWADNQSDIAHAAGFDTSTISRIPTHWSIGTPHGVLPIRAFMDSGVPMMRGRRRISRLAVETSLFRLVMNEAIATPLTDDQLVSLLADAGIRISRRTVAKYRSDSGIPPAWRRKAWRAGHHGTRISRFRKQGSRPTDSVRRPQRAPEDISEPQRHHTIEAFLRQAALPDAGAASECPRRPQRPSVASATAKAEERAVLLRRALRQVVASLSSAPDVADTDLARLLRFRGLDASASEISILRKQLFDESQRFLGTPEDEGVV